MKERPILFSPALDLLRLATGAPMVRAILAGAKTQTRRVAKWKPYDPGYNLAFSGASLGFYNEAAGARSGWVLRSRGAGGCWNDRTHPLHCPYGEPGDRLWVRETFGILTGNGIRTVYRADGAPMTCGGTEPVRDMKWHPSIFMRRHQSRITLEVTGVRVERVQSISREDAIAEGARHLPDLPPSKLFPNSANQSRWSMEDPEDCGHCLGSPQSAFGNLWIKINGAESWASNPWVWVVEFKRIESVAGGRAA